VTALAVLLLAATALAVDKTGTKSADVIIGTSGADSLRGAAGNDTIWGGSDTISARDGFRDVIDCCSGNDRVTADRHDRIARDCNRVSRR
jgi:Ca2+-binding RTX toxin-like protein